MMLTPRMSASNYSGLCDLVNKFGIVNGFDFRKKTSSFSEAHTDSLFGDGDKNVIARRDFTCRGDSKYSFRAKFTCAEKRRGYDLKNLTFHYVTLYTNPP